MSCLVIDFIGTDHVAQIVAALQWIVLIFESTFVQVVVQQLDEERHRFEQPLSPSSVELSIGHFERIPPRSRLRSTAGSAHQLLGTSPELSDGAAGAGNFERIRRATSNTSLNSLGSPVLPVLSLNSIYGKIWLGLAQLDKDPHLGVSQMARTVTDCMRAKARDWLVARDGETSAANRSYTLSTSSNESVASVDSKPCVFVAAGTESPPRATNVRSTPSSASRMRKRSIPSTVSSYLIFIESLVYFRFDI